MKRKQPSRRDLLSSCAEPGPDDGIDPRIYFRKTSEKKPNRKALQLCAEAARALGHALAWEVTDDLLGRLQVESVVPAPDSSRLLVVVSLRARPGTITPDEVLERLRQVTGRLRAEVAAAVCRRKAPELAFQVALCEEVDQ
jgi:ribosome-binding factor A